MDQYRVFGNPISQSKSPIIHQEFATSSGIDIEYKAQLVELEQFEQAIREFMDKQGKGANVTVPFKERAFNLCDELSLSAQKAEAVNTLIFSNGKILGDNTDGIGLVNDLINHQVNISQQRILILGAGGAAKGVILPLLEQNPTSITIANRTLSKAQAICNLHNNDKLTAMSYQELIEGQFDIIINATSTSLTNATLPISDTIIASSNVCYDMVYGDSLTPFLAKAKALGIKTIVDGLGMLVEQAAESFTIWTGVKPETKTVYQILRKSDKSE